LKPRHFLCRFNHGVIMFKLGFFIEALSDFEMVVEINGKDSWGWYNYGLCLAQMGRYQEAVDMLSKSISVCPSNDTDLLFDAYKLKGICFYRLGDAIEAIKQFNIASRFRE